MQSFMCVSLHPQAGVNQAVCKMQASQARGQEAAWSRARVAPESREGLLYSRK